MKGRANYPKLFQIHTKGLVGMTRVHAIAVRRSNTAVLTDYGWRDFEPEVSNT